MEVGFGSGGFGYCDSWRVELAVTSQTYFEIETLLLCSSLLWRLPKLIAQLEIQYQAFYTHFLHQDFYVLLSKLRGQFRQDANAESKLVLELSVHKNMRLRRLSFRTS